MNVNFILQMEYNPFKDSATHPTITKYSLPLVFMKTLCNFPPQQIIVFLSPTSYERIHTNPKRKINNSHCWK